MGETSLKPNQFLWNEDLCKMVWTYSKHKDNIYLKWKNPLMNMNCTYRASIVVVFFISKRIVQWPSFCVSDHFKKFWLCEECPSTFYIGLIFFLDFTFFADKKNFVENEMYFTRAVNVAYMI